MTYTLVMCVSYNVAAFDPPALRAAAATAHLGDGPRFGWTEGLVTRALRQRGFGFRRGFNGNRFGTCVRHWTWRRYQARLRRGHLAFSPRVGGSRPGRRGGHRRRARPPAGQDRADRLGKHRLARRCWRRRARFSPTNMPKAIPAGAITAAANMSTWSRRSPSSAPSSCSAANFANVQPNSGSQMNQAVFLALLQPGDTFMGLDLAAGGHLTHGSPVNMSRQMVQAGLLWRAPRGPAPRHGRGRAGWRASTSPSSSSPAAPPIRASWDFERFREIADEVGAYLMVDMAHFAGLVAGGVHPNPVPHAHVVTTTTHKRCAARAAA